MLIKRLLVGLGALGLLGECGKGDAVQPSYVARKALIDEVNQRPDPVIRVSFGEDDTQMLVESTDDRIVCTQDVLNKFAVSIGVRAHALGFNHLKCKTRPQPEIAPAAPAAPAPPAPPAPPIEVTARQLFADYQANEVSADAKYRGESLRVTGIVTKIAKDVLDKPYIELQTQNEFSGVLASFASESAVIDLKKGQKIVATCRGNGVIVGNPTLTDCAIEHVFERVR